MRWHMSSWHRVGPLISMGFPRSRLSPTPDLADPWVELGPSSLSLYTSGWQSKGTESQVAASRLSGEPGRRAGRGKLPLLVPCAHLGLEDTGRHPQGLVGMSSAEITQEPATPRGPEGVWGHYWPGDGAEGKQLCNVVRGARLPSLGPEHPWKK